MQETNVTDAPKLTESLLLQAYAMGIFPMAETRDATEIFWVDPNHRGILPLDGFHISRSLKKAMQKLDLKATLNANFENVVLACADRADTWINDEIFALYQSLHAQGHAHSLEVWDGETCLGGVYGVAIGGAFFGESMFSSVRNGSKIALAFLTLHLRQCGYALFDTQFLTDHLASLGGQEISREGYHTRLEEALNIKAAITARPLPQLQDVLQRKTQTS